MLWETYEAQKEYFKELMCGTPYEMKLFRTVRETINEWDPIGLLNMGTPDDEYDMEAGLISYYILKAVGNISANGLASEISDIFSKSYATVHISYLRRLSEKIMLQCFPVAVKIISSCATDSKMERTGRKLLENIGSIIDEWNPLELPYICAPDDAYEMEACLITGFMGRAEDIGIGELALKLYDVVSMYDHADVIDKYMVSDRFKSGCFTAAQKIMSGC